MKTKNLLAVSLAALLSANAAWAEIAAKSYVDQGLETKQNKLTTGSITSTLIADKTITNDDISDSAAIASSKLAAIPTSKITGLDTALTGKVTANTAITGATKTKITYDSKGLVTKGENLATSDIPAGLVASGTNVTVTRNTSGVYTISATDTNTVYTLPVAGTALGGIKSGGDIEVEADGKVAVIRAQTADSATTATTATSAASATKATQDGNGAVISSTYEKLANRVNNVNSSSSSETYPTAKAVWAAISALEKTDTAVTGKYVSAVSQEDGVITVTRADLPTFTDNLDWKTSKQDTLDPTASTGNITGANGITITKDASTKKITISGTTYGLANSTSQGLVKDGTGSDINIASGIVTIKDNAVDAAAIANGAITNADINASAGIEYTKLGAIPISKITNLQTSLNAKQDGATAVKYAGAQVGSATKPVYVDANGKVVEADTYPTVNNGTIKFTQGGADKGSFTTNASGTVTIALTDNNTTYTNGTGLGLSGTTFSLSTATSSVIGGVKGGGDIEIGSGGIMNIGANNVTTAKIKDANVTLAKLAPNSVNSAKIVDGSIDMVADLALPEESPVEGVGLADACKGDEGQGNCILTFDGEQFRWELIKRVYE